MKRDSSDTTEWPGEEIQRLQFFLRSGNSFVVDGVEDWGMRHLDGRVHSLRLVQKTDPRYAKLIVDSIDLAQIEAVVILPASDPGAAP